MLYFDLNNYFADASFNLQPNFIMMFDTDLLEYLLIFWPEQLIHALFEITVKSPKMHFNSECYVYFVVHPSCSLPLS